MALLRGRPDFAPEGIYNNCEEIYDVIYLAWSVVHTFTKPVKEIMIRLGTHAGDIMLSPDGINWSSLIYVPGHCSMNIPFETHSFKVRSATTSGWCSYIVTGFFQE